MTPETYTTAKINELNLSDTSITLYKKQIAEIVKGYAQIKCMEQRQVCAELARIATNDNYEAYKAAFNAPEPEM